MATTTRSCANSATVLHGIRHRLRADGPAAILGIGTANPKNCVPQDQFADWYLDVTKVVFGSFKGAPTMMQSAPAGICCVACISVICLVNVGTHLGIT
jgi:hypothetical protein